MEFDEVFDEVESVDDGAVDGGTPPGGGETNDDDVIVCAAMGAEKITIAIRFICTH